MSNTKYIDYSNKLNGFIITYDPSDKSQVPIFHVTMCIYVPTPIKLSIISFILYTTYKCMINK